MTTHATGQSLPLPGNGTYNAARFTQARKQLADAMAAPVFTDAERAAAAASAWATDSLYRLALWLRNVQRVAAERAVAQAKQQTAAAQAHAHAHAAFPVLEYGTARLAECRRALMQKMGNSVFSAAERLRANDATYQCHDLRQLGRWLVNVGRRAAEREAELWAAHEAGAESFVSELTR